MAQIDDFLSGPSSNTQQPRPSAGQGSDDIDSFLGAPAKPSTRSAADVARDVGVTALKGAVGLPQAFVGLADIATGGHAGRALENVGVRFGDAQKALDEMYSPAQQAANRRVAEAEGFVGTARAMLENPSTIATAVGESVPQMLGGAGVARGLMRAGQAAGRTIAPWAAGAAGEGVLGAGSAAEQIREQTDDGLLTGRQAALSLGSGIATGGLGALGGRVSQRLGVTDVDTMLARGTASAAGQTTTKGIPRQVVEAAIAEGALEEMPQSAAEQIMQNLALDRPWDEGVSESAAAGLLAGVAMGGAGGGVGAVGARRADQRQRAAQAETPTDEVMQIGNEPDPLVVFPDGSVARRGEVDAYIASLPEEQQVEARARMMGLGPQQADQPEAAPTVDEAPAPLEAEMAQPSQEAPEQTATASVAPATDLDPRPPSQRMGINPAAGPLSRGAAVAVDGGATAQITGDMNADPAAPVVRMGDERAPGAAAAATAGAGGQAGGAADAQPDRARGGLPAAQAVPGVQSAVPAGSVAGQPAAGVSTALPYTNFEGVPLESSPDQAQQAAAQQPQAGGQAPAGRAAPATATDAAPAGGGDLQAAGLSGQAVIDDQQAGADTALDEQPRPITGPQRFAVRRVEASIRRQTGNAAYVLEPVESLAGAGGERGREFAFAAGVAREAFGVNVIPVRQPGGRVFNGAQSGNNLLLDIDTDKPAMAVVGHEILHQLRKDDPMLYRFLQVQIERALKPGAAEGYAAELRQRYGELGLEALNNDVSMEELLADIVGDQFSRPAFWDMLAQRNERLTARIARKVLEFLDKILNAGRAASPFGTDRYLADVQQARQVVADVLAEYGQGKTGQPRLSAARGTTTLMPDNQAPGPRSAAQQGANKGNAGTVYDQRFMDNDMTGLAERAKRIAYAEEDYRLPNLMNAVPADMVPPQARQKTVTVYRGVPSKLDGAAIRPGDWIGLDPKYAGQHGTGETGASQVISMTVPAADVVWAGTDMNEFFYAPAAMAKEGERAVDLLNRLGEDGFNNWGKSSANDQSTGDAQQGATTGEAVTNYRGMHTAPSRDYGSSGADLTPAFPSDIYSSDAEHIYGHGIPADKKALNIIKSMRGKPDSEVTIYRAVPKDAGSEIAAGDWVTLTRDYATDHGDGVLDGDYKIIETKVKASDIVNDGSSIHEWGYRPNEQSTPDSDGVRFSLASAAAQRVGQAIDAARPVARAMAGRPASAPASAQPGLTAGQQAFLNKIGAKTTPTSDALASAMDRAGLKIRQGMVDRYAALKDLDEQVHGKEFINSAITDSSWVLAKMSSAASGALNAMMTTGRIEYDARQKVIGLKGEPNGGLIESLKKLGGPAEVERFFGWVAANRAEKLMAEGRENLFTPQEIADGKLLNQGRTDDGKTRPLLYAQAFKDFQQYRDDVLAIAEQAGIISDENRALWRDEFYVPFYRVMDEGASKGGPAGGKGLSRQEAFKKLKGGRENLNDLMENTLMNFHHLLSVSLKNQAATQAIRNAQKAGIAKKVPESNRDTDTSTFILENGRKVFYQVDDPLVYESITALADPGLNNFAVRAMGAFKRVFTNMTTVTPQFVIANTFRDLLQSSATSPTSKNVGKNVVEGLKTYRDQKTRAEMLASGGAFSFGHIYGMDPDEVKASLRKTVKGAELITGPSMVPAILRKGWDAWGKVTDTSENISRAATYAQNVQDKGKLRAAFEARDVMDFSQHGAWPAIRLLIRVVPFLNARLQGLDKLYRSGVKPAILTAMGQGTASDKEAATRFATVAGALTLASLALYMANADDEEYQKLEEWQKDSYWFFRIGDNAFFLPKPFEVGAMATMAERVAQQFMDDKATGKLFADRMKDMLMQTFAFNPVPQMAQPLIDVYSNKDAFTKRDIETAGMERLSMGLRARDDTTVAGRALSAASRVLGDESFIAVSPVQADHLIKGYLGSVGATAAGTIDTIWRTAMGQESPDKRLSEMQPIRRFYRDLGVPAPYSRYSTLFYDGLREANRVYADVMELQKLGRPEDAQELRAEKAGALRMRMQLNRAQRQLSDINKDIQAVRRSDLDGAMKRQRIDLLNTRKALITERYGKMIEDERASG